MEKRVECTDRDVCAVIFLSALYPAADARDEVRAETQLCGGTQLLLYHITIPRRAQAVRTAARTALARRRIVVW